MSNPAPPRRKRTVDQGRALITAWKKSGLTAIAFARIQGINAKRLDYWQRRIRNLGQDIPPPSRSADRCPAFIRIEAGEGPAHVDGPSASSSSAPMIEALLPNGIRLAIPPCTDLPHLVAVVAALSRMVVAC